MTTEPLPAVAAGCAWPVDSACFEETWDALDDTIKARAIDLASATLIRLTGYRVGGCPITVRPCKRGCAGGYLPSYYDMLSAGSGASFWPHVNTSGFWVNSCGCSTDCSCDALCEIALPPPVGRVDLVMVDGVELEPEFYRVDGNSLVWIGEDECPFPTCQNMRLGDDEVGTFSITYLNAHPVDTLGAYAAGVMAMEFAKACTGGKCRLPSSVSSITRQGVSMEIVTGAFPDGVTGIREVDTFLSLWNPGKLRQQTQVWTPDMPRVRVVPTVPTP